MLVAAIWRLSVGLLTWQAIKLVQRSVKYGVGYICSAISQSHTHIRENVTSAQSSATRRRMRHTINNTASWRLLLLLRRRRRRRKRLWRMLPPAVAAAHIWSKVVFLLDVSVPHRSTIDKNYSQSLVWCICTTGGRHNEAMLPAARCIGPHV